MSLKQYKPLTGNLPHDLHINNRYLLYHPVFLEVLEQLMREWQVDERHIANVMSYLTFDGVNEVFRSNSVSEWNALRWQMIEGRPLPLTTAQGNIPTSDSIYRQACLLANNEIKRRFIPDTPLHDLVDI